MTTENHSEGSFREAIHEDFAHATIAQKAGYLATGSLLTAHELGMEAAVLATYLNTYEATGQPWAAVVAVGALSLATEATLTIGMSDAIKRFTATTGYLKETYFSQTVAQSEPSNHRQRIVAAADTALLAAGLGSAGVIVRDYSRNPDHTAREYRRVGFKAAAGLSTVNMAYTGAISATSWITEKLHTPIVSDVINDVAHSPFTYPVILAAVAGRTWLKVRQTFSRRKGADTISETTTAKETE